VDEVVIDPNEVLLMRAAEVARTLGLSRSKIYQMMRDGALPVVRVGRAVRVPKAVCAIGSLITRPRRREASREPASMARRGNHEGNVQWRSRENRWRGELVLDANRRYF
jgi:excisionase family DNA binding protein